MTSSLRQHKPASHLQALLDDTVWRFFVSERCAIPLRTTFLAWLPAVMECETNTASFITAAISLINLSFRTIQHSSAVGQLLYV